MYSDLTKKVSQMKEVKVVQCLGKSTLEIWCKPRSTNCDMRTEPTPFPYVIAYSVFISESPLLRCFSIIHFLIPLAISVLGIEVS